MVKIYTDSFILQYLYNELNKQQTEKLAADLIKDTVLFNRVQTLAKTINKLNKIGFEPSPTSVDIVMEYAATLASESKQPVKA